MASGGYRKPTNPAPASGPGRLSRRTDGGPGQKLMVASGLDYGERQQTLAQERTTPMAQADPISPVALPAPSASPSPTSSGMASPSYQGVPFGSPTQRPNEPITHGTDIGPGGGPEVMPPMAQPQVQAQGPMAQMLAQMGGLTGPLAALYQAASARGV